MQSKCIRDYGSSVRVNDNSTVYWAVIDQFSPVLFHEILQWCYENIELVDPQSSIWNRYLTFENENDLTAYKLRWGVNV